MFVLEASCFIDTYRLCDTWSIEEDFPKGGILPYEEDFRKGAILPNEAEKGEKEKKREMLYLIQTSQLRCRYICFFIVKKGAM